MRKEVDRSLCFKLLQMTLHVFVFFSYVFSNHVSQFFHDSFFQITFRKKLDDFNELFAIEFEEIKDYLTTTSYYENNPIITTTLTNIEKSFKKIVSNKSC